MLSQRALQKERREQASAIFNEIQSIESDSLDFGKKISVPRDIMLEELTLFNNRGARLFKKRQRRSDKYTYENFPYDMKPQTIQNQIQQQQTPKHQNENSEGATVNSAQQISPQTPPNTPDPRSPPNPESIAPGYTGPLKEIPPEKFNETAVPKYYMSPWQEAIVDDPDLLESLYPKMPNPGEMAETPDFRSFNRAATPFGGFENASKLTRFKVPEYDLFAMSDPTFDMPNPLSTRRSFNRTAQGWTSDQVPIILYSDLFNPDVPETDDL
ncbi:myozenin-2 isoform X1 [Pelobates cultripes]|uniref:Myozenin-2 isoform X1 n=1 Tax=Pelobates cultripes TaxID=61616 RepID=A0AAD1WDJ3_PELCU|nr:myozenin-2 isoform X1 [Pelobates cultripes]